MKQFWAKTQNSCIFEQSDDNFKFVLFLKINTEMLNRMTEFKENQFFG